MKTTQNVIDDLEAELRQPPKFVNENYNKEFTAGHFIVGDEVYLIDGDGEPFGMVVRIGRKNIYIKPHDAQLNPTIVKKPTELYLGKEWHSFNPKQYQ
jgi:hypothetical protein